MDYKELAKIGVVVIVSLALYFFVLSPMLVKAMPAKDDASV